MKDKDQNKYKLKNKPGGHRSHREKKSLNKKKSNIYIFRQLWESTIVIRTGYDLKGAKAKKQKAKALGN